MEIFCMWTFGGNSFKWDLSDLTHASVTFVVCAVLPCELSMQIWMF